MNNTAHFDLYLLGSMTDVNLGGIYTRDPDVQLIDKIEEAQVNIVFHLLLCLEFSISLSPAS